MTNPEIVLSNASFPKATRVLLSEQTASTLLANIVHVYFHHFGVVFGSAALPFVLPAVLLTVAKLGQPQPTVGPAVIAGFGLMYMSLFLVPAVLTLVLSDICLGNVPTLKRAFWRILEHRRWWHLFTTVLLITLAVLAGAVLLIVPFVLLCIQFGQAMLVGLPLLIVPFVWFFIRSMFAMTIVTLEGRRNLDAIRRSFALTKGQAWRLAGLFLLTYLFSWLVLALVGLVLAAVAGVVESITPALGIDANIYLDIFMPALLILLYFGVTLPLSAMPLVLLYYDQRVRRESYDVQALSEDLMR